MTGILLNGLSSLIFFPLELFGASLALSFPLEKRMRFPLRIIGSALLFLLAALLGTLHFLLRKEPAENGLTRWGDFGRSFFWCALIFLLIVGTLCLSRSISAREAVYCGSCSYLVQHLAYCARILLTVILPGVKMEAGSFLYCMVTIGVYLGAYFLFTRPMVQRGHYATTGRPSLWLMVAVLAVVLVMSIFASAFRFEILHSIYAIFCGLFVLVGEVNRQRELRLQEELDFQRELAARQKVQYELSRDNIDIINRKCHDLKHQVAAIRNMGDGEKKDRVLTDLEKSVMIYDSILKTGNDALDTVLTEKSLVCKSNRITLSCIANGELLSFMEEIDLYTLFGNAMDNAIEAVSQLPEEERLIDLTVREVAGLTVIKLVNNFSGALELDEYAMPVTSKEDKSYHGFGVRSIRLLCEKYGGNVRIHAGGGRFTIQMTFPPREE